MTPRRRSGPDRGLRGARLQARCAQKDGDRAACSPGRLPGCFISQNNVLNGEEGMAHKRMAFQGVTAAVLGILLATASAAGIAQTWKPEKAVEVVVSSAPGGSNDRIARTLQRIMQEQKLVTAPVSVLNKPGGNQTISRVYINQNPGDAHYMDIGNPTLIANTIAGRQQYTDFTPIALL